VKIEVSFSKGETLKEIISELKTVNSILFSVLLLFSFIFICFHILRFRVRF